MQSNISLPITGLKRFFQNKQINIGIKLLVVALVVWVLYQQIFLRDNIDELYIAFRQNFQLGNAPWLIAAILLMPINWMLENLKWRVLIRNFTKLSFSESFKAIWAGVTFSIFTPNRVGSYGGRILFVKPEHNWKAVIATLVGSFSQLLVIVSMGLLGLVYFSHFYLEVESYLLSSGFLLGVGVISVFGFCFFNVDLIIPFVKRLPFIHYLKRFVKDIVVLKNYTRRELSEAVLYALLRYLTYCLQYFFLLRFFGIEVTLGTAMAGIATIYLIQTSLPVTPLLGIFARVEIAFFVWGFFSDNKLNILASTFGLWIINVIVPALIGTVFIANVNVLKSLGYETDEE